MDVIVSGVEHKLCFCKPVDESAGGYEQTAVLTEEWKSGNIEACLLFRESIKWW